MMFWEIADGEVTKEIVFYSDTPTYDEATKTSTTAWTLFGTVTCLLWDASNATQFISGEFRDRVSAVLFPSDSTGLNKNMKAVDGTDEYKVLHTADIGNQGEVFICYLEEYKND